MTELEQVSHAVMVFMRGKYRLDEVGNGKDEVKFKLGKRTIFTACIKEDYFNFLLVFGKKERDAFEAQREDFSPEVQAIYDGARTYHDGKWMWFPAATLAQWEEIKKLVLIKKKPNRKPFPKDGAIYSLCGQRCDLCVHYIHQDEERRQLMIPPLTRMYGITDWSMRCGGCQSDSCYCSTDNEPCFAKACQKAPEGRCRDCPEHPCINATTSDKLSMIHTETHDADEITWGILPYVPYQYTL